MIPLCSVAFGLPAKLKMLYVDQKRNAVQYLYCNCFGVMTRGRGGREGGEVIDLKQQQDGLGWWRGP